MRKQTRRCWPVRNGTASCVSSLGYVTDSGNNVGVSGTPTNIAAHAFRDLRVGQNRRGRNVRRRITRPARLVFSQQRHRRANLTGRAISALQSVMAHKRRLHWVEIAAFFQTLDGCDLIAGMHHSERQAAVDTLSIDDDRASAALALVAALLRTG